MSKQITVDRVFEDLHRAIDAHDEAALRRFAAEYVEYQELQQSNSREISGIQTGITALIDAMNHRFEAVDKRFEAVEKRFEAMDKRFEDLIRFTEKRFDDVNRRFDDVNRRFDDVNKRFDDVNKRFNDVNRQFRLIIWVVSVSNVTIIGVMTLYRFLIP